MIRYKFTITREKTTLWKQTSDILPSEDVPMRGLSGGGIFSLSGNCSQSSFRRCINFAAGNAAESSSCNSFSYSHTSITEFGLVDLSHFLGLAFTIQDCSSTFIVVIRSFLTTWVSFSQVARKRVFVSIKITFCSTTEIFRFTYDSYVFELLTPDGVYKHLSDPGFHTVSNSWHYKANKYLADWFEEL